MILVLFFATIASPSVDSEEIRFYYGIDLQICIGTTRISIIINPNRIYIILEINASSTICVLLIQPLCFILVKGRD